MPEGLRIKKFSCIENASVDFARLMVLIGPQASGKSIISKLTYFAIQSLFSIVRFIREEKTIDDFKAYLQERFAKNFPMSTWGDAHFSIELTLGNITIDFQRTRSQQLSKAMRISFSASFEKLFQEARNIAEDFKKEFAKREDKNVFFRDFTFRLEFESVVGNLISKGIGSRYFDRQTFIPAGRSFSLR
jgi:predicted ATP-dependent endonuclease of OLD family